MPSQTLKAAWRRFISSVRSETDPLKSKILVKVDTTPAAKRHHRVLAFCHTVPEDEILNMSLLRIAYITEQPTMNIMFPVRTDLRQAIRDRYVPRSRQNAAPTKEDLGYSWSISGEVYYQCLMATYWSDRLLNPLNEGCVLLLDWYKEQAFWKQALLAPGALVVGAGWFIGKVFQTAFAAITGLSYLNAKIFDWNQSSNKTNSNNVSRHEEQQTLLENSELEQQHEITQRQQAGFRADAKAEGQVRSSFDIVEALEKSTSVSWNKLPETASSSTDESLVAMPSVEDKQEISQTQSVAKQLRAEIVFGFNQALANKPIEKTVPFMMATRNACQTGLLTQQLGGHNQPCQVR